MPTYAAFLRAINLGAHRKFPKNDIKRCVEAAGGTEVETHINTGNVRLTTPMRSRERVEAALEAAFAADRGFEVPTIAFRVDELAGVGADVDRLATDLARAEGGPAYRHYVTLLKREPDAGVSAELEALEYGGERARVLGRAVHVLLTEVGYAQARLGNARLERACGVATTRDAKVIRALVAKWC